MRPFATVGWLAVTAVLALPGVYLPAQAAINKCVAADGKVVFSDQPCAPSQAATTIKQGAAAKPGAVAPPPAKPGDPFAMLTPECRLMQKQIDDKLMGPAAARLSDEVMTKVVEKYEAQCVPLIKAAQDAEWAKGKPERDAAQKRLECTTKKTLFDERKARFASLSDGEKKMVTLLGEDIGRNCN